MKNAAPTTARTSHLLRAASGTPSRYLEKESRPPGGTERTVIARTPAILIAAAVALIGSAGGAARARAARSYTLPPGESLTAVATTHRPNVAPPAPPNRPLAAR